MKKSKYVSKYDYIAYYTKQKAMWFFTNAEVQAALKAQYNLYAKNHNEISDVEEDEFEDNELSESWLNTYKENKISQEYTNWDTVSMNQKDQYTNLFLSAYFDVKDADKNNPLMIEGIIIEEKAKQFIINKFNKNNDFKIVDFDLEKLNIEQLSIKTKEELLNNNKVIIFQPTFIDTKRNIVTKCDFLVKDEENIIIIENKATSSCKWAHFLDLLYQKKVIENIDYLSKFNFYYELCLIAYEKLSKGNVSFITTDAINLSKTVATDKKKQSEDEIQNKKIGKKTHPKSFEDTSFYIDELLNQYFDDDKFNGERNKVKKQYIMNLESEFDLVINKLWEVKNLLNDASLPTKFFPSYNDKSDFKNTDTWLELRKLYASEGYQLFNYSGNVVDQSGLTLSQFENGLNPNFQVKDYFKKTDYEEYFIYNNKDFTYIDKQNTLNYLSELKDKKVYFDFETINSAIRVIDNTYAFTQIITQCSIIKTIDSKNYVSECNNLMIDPQNINIEWFKQIVDDLYEGEECSYVVYNKSFESSRLNEMIDYIKDEKYTQKIRTIIDNIYDLADFFTLNKRCILVKELGGFYSIKKVLPLIEKYAPEIFKLTKCHDYKTLNINNGALCQQKTACRFLNLVDDKEWEQIVKDSKIYCENDVRAMIAVYLFIKDFLIPNIEK